MKIYLAGSSKQRSFIAYLARQIEQQGHEITHKWWVDYNDDMVFFRSAALADLNGVRAAEVVVAVLDHEQVSPGAHLEMGYALALGRPILALLSDSYNQLRENIWLHLREVTKANQRELSPAYLGKLIELAAQVGAAESMARAARSQSIAAYRLACESSGVTPMMDRANQ